MAINKITFNGFVGGVNPIRKFQNGTSMISFSVAVSSSYRNKEGNYERAWYNVKKFDKTGKYVEWLAQNVKSGTSVIVEGTLEFDPISGGPKVYQKNDGTWASSFQIIADQIHIIPVSRDQKAGPQMYSVDDDKFNNMDDMPVSWY